MLRSTEQMIEQGMQRHIIREHDLANLFKGSAARRYGLVNKALKKGELIRLCRGVYVLNPKFSEKSFSRYYLANRIVANSFVTAESALEFHGWIPERVVQVTSAVAEGRSREFNTPLGGFVYHAFPVTAEHFFNGVELVELGDQKVYIASPLRALMDYIYCHKVKSANVDWLQHSLRIDSENILDISIKKINNVEKTYRNSRVNKFLSNLKEEVLNEKPNH